MKVKEGRV